MGILDNLYNPLSRGDIVLKNQTSGVSRKGYLVKSVRDGFDYADPGDTPIGVIIDSVPKGQKCSIKTSGDAIAYISHIVSAGDELRMHTSTEGGRAGAMRNIGTETSYVSIGRAIGKGRGLVRIALNITARDTSSSGGGSSGDHLLLTNIGVNAHTVIDAHIADITTNPHGILIAEGLGIDVLIAGVSNTVSLDLSELIADDGTAFGTTSYFVFTAGSDPGEKIRTTLVPISTFVNDSGYTANVGTVTSVTASIPLASSGGANPNITFDADTIPLKGGALLADDWIVVIDAISGAMEKKLIANIPLGEFNNDEGWASGTVESVIGGYGITSDADPVNPSIAFDGSELDVDDGTAFGGTSYFVFVAGAVSELRRTTSVAISTFVNDSGFTSNTGTVTSVTASVPLASSGGLNPNITFDASSVPTKGGALLADDFLMTIDGVSGAMEKKLISLIPLGEFDNNEGWEASPWVVVTGGRNYSGGYVGIGDSTPLHQLDVTQSSGTAGIQVKASNISGQAGTLRLRNTYTSQAIGAEAGRIEFYKDDLTTEGAGHVGRIWSETIDAGGSYNLKLTSGQDVDAMLGTNAELTLDYRGYLYMTGPSSSLIDIQGGGTGSASLRLRGTASSSAYILFTQLTSTKYIMGYDDTYNNFQINVGSSMASATDFSINSSGNIGIGDSTPSYRLDVNGTGRFVSSLISNSEITAYSSDGRLKHSIVNIPNPLDMIDKINGVYYSWKDGVEELGFIPTRKREIGFIAQNLLPIVPDAVAPAPFDHDGEGNSLSGEDYLTVKPEKLIPLLVEGIKELRMELNYIKGLSAKY